MRSESRTLWFAVAKVAVAVLGTVFLLRWLFESTADEAARDFLLAPLALALLLNQLSMAFAGERFRQVLAANAVELSFMEGLSLQLQAMFYFFFVPLSVGYDAARFVKVRRRQPALPSSRMIWMLVSDRVFGMIAALLCLAVTLPLVAGAAPAWFDSRIWILLVVLAVPALVLSWLLWRHFRARLLPLLHGVRSQLLRLRGRGILLLVYALASHLCGALAVLAAAHATGIDVEASLVVFGFSAAVLAMVVPASLLGFGLAELAAGGVFMALGISAGDAMALAVFSYCGRLVGALQGGGIELAQGFSVLLETTRRSDDAM